jgi:hypothetical protein
MQMYLIMAVIGLLWSAGITTGGYIKGHVDGVATATKTCNANIAKQKEEANKIIAFEAARVEATEKRLRESKDNQEIQDANNQKKITVLSGRVRALSDVVGRLRDPNAGRGPGSGSPQGGTPTDASNSVYNRAEAAGLLSIQLSGLLREKSLEADEINAAYISCRADAFSVRAGYAGGVR